jgi:hypothetical protein
MTELLERAIAKVRALPDSEQDKAAETLDEFVREAEALRSGTYRLSTDERAAIRESRTQARRGEFASDEDMDAFWNRHGR